MGEIFSWKRAARSLDFTGERWTTAVSGQIEFEHLHRYLVARDLCRDKDVLDIACGEGYGAALLGGVARHVIGVDIDPSSVSHAAAEYARPNLHYVAGDARDIPLAGGSIDVVVSFETFEHFAEQEAFLAELRRVLRPGGLLVISTPDSEVYSPIGGPANPYHVREVSQEEFGAALSRHFRHVVMLAQRPLIGSAIVARSGAPSAPPVTFERRDDRHFERSPGLPRAVYLIACASQQPITAQVGTSLYIDSGQFDVFAQEAAARTEPIAAPAEPRAAETERSATFDEVIALQAQLLDAQAALGISRAALLGAEQKLVGQQEHLEAILSSTLWRSTYPLRLIGAKVPSSLRGVLRRVARLTWRTITLAALRRLGDVSAASGTPKHRAARSPIPVIAPERRRRVGMRWWPGISWRRSRTQAGLGAQRSSSFDATVAHGSTERSKPEIYVPNLAKLRGVKPRGGIAVVLHLFHPDLWPEMRQAIDKISLPFDLFVSLVKGVSEHMRQPILAAFPFAYIFDFANHGRDIGPFIVFLRSGVLFQYDVVCKLHAKRSPYRPDGDVWRHRLIAGILGSSALIDKIIASFKADPDLGMVVADGEIYRGEEHWAANEPLLRDLLPRIGISADLKGRSFPGGSIFWIRPLLLRTLAGIGVDLRDFDPEPWGTDGALGHAVERIFGLICEDAGMRIVEHGQLPTIVRQPSCSSKVNLIAFYLPQFHPILENNEWWGDGFTEWSNVTRAKPLYTHHRQPRLPQDLGFYDLRIPEVRKAQANLAKRYGITAFCYYFYWFNGRRILELPLDEVITTGRPDFPFLICWANESWTRNWDGLNREVLLRQSYEIGWVRRFAHDVAPVLHDRRYFRIGGEPMLLIYRIGDIPDAASAMQELRAALAEEGIPKVHLSAAWVAFAGGRDLPHDPNVLGIDTYYRFPPHGLPEPPVQLSPPGLAADFTGAVYDYDHVVTANLAALKASQGERYFAGVMAGWDCTARRKSDVYIFHGATPTNFRRWLRGAVAHEAGLPGERAVFINAWNEWAQGTYLEPDSDFGRGWLEAVASVLDVGNTESLVSCRDDAKPCQRSGI